MRLLLGWSSGKDSAYALSRLRTHGNEIAGLLTTVTKDFARVSMHGVRKVILDAQARAVGLPLVKVEIPYPCPNEIYEAKMEEALRGANGIEGIAFGDLFLEDVRTYREKNLARANLKGVFPLWGLPTRPLAEEMIEAGLEAYVCVLDPKRLPREEIGARFDRAFLDRLPPDVDPCAERGEFHTVVANAPGFSAPLHLAPGETVERDGFLFRDFSLLAV